MSAPREVVLRVGADAVDLAVAREGDEWVVRAGPGEQRLRLTPLEPGTFLLTSGGRSYLVHAAAHGGRGALHVDGRTLEYRVERRAGAGRRGSGAEDLSAPMPGVVAQVLVREGDRVTPGQALVIVEAMKMEHVIRAPRAGVVRALRVRQGAQVEGGAVVAEIGPPGGA